MSFTDVAQPAKSQKPSQAWKHRIRKGQKLDEVTQIIETRPASDEASAEASTSASVSFNPSQKQSATEITTASGGDSPFQLQEYLAMLVRQDPHDVEHIISLPSEADIESATSFFSAPKAGNAEEDGPHQPVDTDIWVYEQLRRLVLDLTTPWLTSLQEDCDREARPETCAAMNAGDWMFLCASHGEEKQCCAIDYMVHTLDGATSLLNSARHFPSRTYVPNTSLRHFGSIARRLSRIFVHAWCYHKEVFSACEAETSLYSRFFALIETYDLTATDNLPPPERAAGSGFGSNSNDGDDFTRGTTLPFTQINGTTARRDRSSTAAPRTSVLHNLQKLHGDDVGTVPPPAPSPRPTAILRRPEHEEGEQDTPAWTSASFTQDDDLEDDSAARSPLSNDFEKVEEDDEDEDEIAEEEDDAEPTVLLKSSSVTEDDADIIESAAATEDETTPVLKGLEENLETSAEQLGQAPSTSSTAVEESSRAKSDTDK